MSNSATAKPRPPAQLIGPIFGWELVRLARRGQDFRARFLLATGLLVVLTLFTLIWFRTTDPYQLFFGTSAVLSTQESARFGEQFTVAFLLAQLAILVLLTPAYAAGGISEEKERKTFLYLLISELTNREIVFGKFLGRLTFVLGVMLAGLPVLALTQVYGGTSEKFLLMGYLLTGCTVIMLAAVSAASAIAVDTYRGALFRAYGFAGLHSLIGGFYPLFSPFVFLIVLWNLEGDSAHSPAFWLAGLGYCAVELGIALISVILAVRWVRKMRAQPIRRKPPVRARKDREPAPKPIATTAPAASPELIILDEPVAVLSLGEAQRIETEEALPKAALLTAPVVVAELPPAPKPVPKFRRPKTPRPRQFDQPEPHPNRPRVWEDDPFLWKETFVSGAKRTADDDQIRGVLVAVGVAVGLVLAFLAFIAFLTVLFSGFSDSGQTIASRILQISGLGGLLLYLLVIGASASGSIVKERQRLTLESLLTIPVSPVALLWPKWRVALSRGWWWGVPTSCLIPTGLLFTTTPLAAFSALFLILGAIPLITSYGLWLSLRCKTMTRAILWCLPVIALTAISPSFCYSVFWDWPIVLYGVLGGLGVLAWSAAGLFWVLTLLDFTPERQLA